MALTWCDRSPSLADGFDAKSCPRKTEGQLPLDFSSMLTTPAAPIADDTSASSPSSDHNPPSAFVSSKRLNETSAVLVNVTVDDAGVDPSTGQSIVYTPGGLWNEGKTCSFCTDKPDPASMHNETWHDATYVPDNGQGVPTGSSNLTFSFNGTAIYAFCAIQHFTNMTFFIDDEPVNRFSQQSDIPLQHSRLLNGTLDGLGNERSTVLFDYLIYLHDEVDEQSSPLPLPLPPDYTV
ncbi:hypothetical protein M422DRAFT_261624 [Sphaerobolus stellatus SS14]|uniref:Uncharacterized protein n=1 Tax=Sphaerobolus stellatus (strain SS14) TaxID=990650 RepID=A0A0C9U050_SPHS4|nr:hypothetical protein M422DRAFT_261624 [Sphaerobolus stellatus SS14]